jgi:hypothetical protein
VGYGGGYGAYNSGYSWGGPVQVGYTYAPAPAYGYGYDDGFGY